MKCPWCQSENAEQTGKFDNTNIELSTCTHDFQCKDCEKFFTVEYAPINSRKIVLDS